MAPRGAALRASAGRGDVLVSKKERNAMLFGLAFGLLVGAIAVGVILLGIYTRNLP